MRSARESDLLIQLVNEFNGCDKTSFFLDFWKASPLVVMFCFRKDDIREAALKGLSPSKRKEKEQTTFYPNYLDMCNFLYEKVRKTIFHSTVVNICTSTLLVYISYTLNDFSLYIHLCLCSDCPGSYF